jgi:hypothetical protein
MYRDQNAGRSYNIDIDNNSFKKVGRFKYLGTALRIKILFRRLMNSRLKSGNACYYRVQMLLSSSLLSKNINIKIYRTIILPTVFMGVNLVAHIEGGT